MFGIPGIHHLITYLLILLIALSIFDTICLLSLNVRQGFKHTTTYTNACIDITFYHLYSQDGPSLSKYFTNENYA